MKPYQNIPVLWDRLAEKPRTVVLYGMGNGADKIISVLVAKGISFNGVFASDGFVRDKYFHNHKITDYKTAKEKFDKYLEMQQQERKKNKGELE